jgi:hypothetical protein
VMVDSLTSIPSLRLAPLNASLRDNVIEEFEAL